MCILLKCLGSGVVTQSVQKDVQGCKESVVHILGDRCPLCMEPTQEIGGRYCVFNVVSMCSVPCMMYYMWNVVCSVHWVGGAYARDGGDTGGMEDQLIPTSEILPKHLHITKCSEIPPEHLHI